MTQDRVYDQIAQYIFEGVDDDKIVTKMLKKKVSHQVIVDTLDQVKEDVIAYYRNPAARKQIQIYYNKYWFKSFISVISRISLTIFFISYLRFYNESTFYYITKLAILVFLIISSVSAFLYLRSAKRGYKKLAALSGIKKTSLMALRRRRLEKQRKLRNE